ncbi:phage tail protein, partial [Escherichia coli]|uniref:phage tail protein n=1 Tax=Escherichia coli TaxID=562 RepID=UPI00202CC6CF
ANVADATTARAGIVRLSSATDSTSETLAATPKAVKSAYDNAEKRLQKDQNGADIPGKDTFTKNIGACRAYSGALSTEAGNWTTAQFIDWLESQGAFNHPYWMCKCSWSYGNNKIITDTDCGTIHLAGCVIEVMGVKAAMTIRVTTPSTSSGGGTTSAQFTYINHGADYAPGWRRDYNTKNKQPAFALGKTGNTVANNKAVGWNWDSGAYCAQDGGASKMVLHFYTGEGSCPAMQFLVDYKNRGIFYRSARDGYGFEADWSEFYTTSRKPTPADILALALSGGSMSGSIKFINDAFLIWERNTDWAKIGFKNDSDADSDSYMWFETGDNGNEYFKWRIRSGSTTKDLMKLKWDELNILVKAVINGEVISRSPNAFRAVHGNYGFFIRNDGSNSYFLLTNAGDQLGSWNGLRPLYINNASGAVTMNNGLTVLNSLGLGTTNALGGNSITLGDNDTGFKQNGDGILDVYANSQRVFRFQNGVAIAFKNIQAGDGKKFALYSSNNSTKNAMFNLWGNSSRPVVAELGDDSGWHFYS